MWGKGDDDTVLLIPKVYWIMFSRPVNNSGVREIFLDKML